MTGERLRATLRRQWWLVMIGAVLGLAVGSGLTLLSSPSYSASSTLFVTGQSATDEPTTAYEANLLAVQKAKTYAGLVTSDRVAQEATDALSRNTPPMTPPVTAAEIRGAVTATAQTDTALINVSVTAASPDRARVIVRAVANASLNLIGEVEQSGRGDNTFPVRVTVVGPEDRSGELVSAAPYIDVLFGLVVGLILGIGAALLRSRFDTGSRSAAELESTTGLQVVGEVGTDPAIAAGSLAVLDDPDSEFARSVRRLRSGLLVTLDDAAPASVLVTSAMAGEGRSVIAANLAAAVAQTGRDVVLVAAGGTHDSIATSFQTDTVPGLAEVLKGTHRVEDVLVSRCDGRLSVLVTGAEVEDTRDLVASPRMTALIREFVSAGRFVVVDAPSLDGSGEAEFLAASSAAVLLVSRFRRTPAIKLRTAASALAVAAAGPVLAVLNGLPARRRARNAPVRVPDLSVYTRRTEDDASDVRSDAPGDVTEAEAVVVADRPAPPAEPAVPAAESKSQPVAEVRSTASDLFQPDAETTVKIRKAEPRTPSPRPRPSLAPGVAIGTSAKSGSND